MTFTITRLDNVKVEVPYFDTFFHMGETWVVHHPYNGDSLQHQVSHKETGHKLTDYRAGMPRSWDSIETAVKMSIEFMDWSGEANVKKWIGNARTLAGGEVLK